jgi:hypothetical protein
MFRGNGQLHNICRTRRLCPSNQAIFEIEASVDLPERSYSECLKLRIENSDNQGKLASTETFYFAPGSGFGLIRVFLVSGTQMRAITISERRSDQRRGRDYQRSDAELRWGQCLLSPAPAGRCR